MTLFNAPEENAPDGQVRAGVPGGGARHPAPTIRSQANAPCLTRPGRSFFR